MALVGDSSLLEFRMETYSIMVHRDSNRLYKFA